MAYVFAAVFTAIVLGALTAASNQFFATNDPIWMGFFIVILVVIIGGALALDYQERGGKPRG